MRIAGLLLVVAIIGYFWSRRGGPAGSASELDEVMGTPAARPAVVSQGSTPNKSQPQPGTSGLRRPIDNTRTVLDKVKGRNGDGEF